MASVDVTLDESLPAELIAAMAAVAEGRELSVVEKLFLNGVRVVEPEAARQHMRREWWKAERKLLVWPAVCLAIALVFGLAYKYQWLAQGQDAQISGFLVEFYGIIAAGVCAVMSSLEALLGRPRWVEHSVIIKSDLPPVARGIPAKVRAALGDEARLFVDKLERRRVLDPGMRVVTGDEEHYLLFYDGFGLPINLPTIDPFDRAA